MGTTIQLQAADGFKFDAYVAQPVQPARAAVVVLQEIFGVNDHIRKVADGYAQAGYLAIAPATFARSKTGVELGYTPDDMNAGFALKTAIEALPAPGVIADIQAAVNHAAAICQGKVGVVGVRSRLRKGCLRKRRHFKMPEVVLQACLKCRISMSIQRNWLILHIACTGQEGLIRLKTINA